MRSRAAAVLLACLLLPGTWATGAAPASAASYGPDLPRSEVDRADDLTGAQVHLVYALPSDGTDRALDTDGTVRRTATSFQTWLEGRTGGRALRLDTSQGSLDVSHVRFGRTDAEIAEVGPFVRDEIEDELRGAGFDDPDKVYAVYYDGTSNEACSGAAYPPDVPGKVAALFLKGLPDSATPCGSNAFAAEGGQPGYLEFAMLQEVLHTMGLVASCAPHANDTGHVTDDPDDLMWGGGGPWAPSGWSAVKLDAGNDDYFRTGSTACPTLDTSPYLVGGPAAPPAPGGSPPAPQPAPTLTLSPATISAGEATTVTYSGTPGAAVDILSRTQPSTVFTKIGTVRLDDTGTATSTHRPQKNTRITARSQDGTLSRTAPIIAVRSVASFNATRVGTRTYSFTGRVYPALSNRLVNLYRDGALVGQGRCDATGIYRITRTLAAGTFTFQVRTPDDQDNLGTRSRELRLPIR